MWVIYLCWCFYNYIINRFLISQYERKNTFANTYYHCTQEFKYIFSVWFFVKSVYNCGILYLVPITLMVINYGRMAHTLVRSLSDSSRMQGADRWELYSNMILKGKIYSKTIVKLNTIDQNIEHVRRHLRGKLVTFKIQLG